jgi:hypothetical protein
MRLLVLGFAGFAGQAGTRGLRPDAIWQIGRPGKSGMPDSCCACDAQILDVEGSIEKLGFDPLDDTKARAYLYWSSLCWFEQECSRKAEDEAECSNAGVCDRQKERLVPSCFMV